jgi:hypothetical protein
LKISPRPEGTGDNFPFQETTDAPKLTEKVWAATAVLKDLRRFFPSGAMQSDLSAQQAQG